MEEETGRGFASVAIAARVSRHPGATAFRVSSRHLRKNNFEPRRKMSERMVEVQKAETEPSGGATATGGSAAAGAGASGTAAAAAAAGELIGTSKWSRARRFGLISKDQWQRSTINSVGSIHRAATAAATAIGVVCNDVRGRKDEAISPPPCVFIVASGRPDEGTVGDYRRGREQQ